MDGTIEDQDPFEQVLWRSWNILLNRGIFISIIGLILFIRPSSGLVFTAVVFAIFMAFDGITQLVIGFRMNNANPFWWGSVLRGVLEIIMAAVIISHPKGFGEFGVTALLILIGMVLIISGIIDFQFKRGRTGIFSSLILIVLGVLFLVAPLFTASFILRIIGFVSLVSGIARILRAIQYKKRSS